MELLSKLNHLMEHENITKDPIEYAYDLLGLDQPTPTTYEVVDLTEGSSLHLDVRLESSDNQTDWMIQGYSDPEANAVFLMTITSADKKLKLSHSRGPPDSVWSLTDVSSGEQLEISCLPAPVEGEWLILCQDTRSLAGWEIHYEDHEDKFWICITD